MELEEKRIQIKKMAEQWVHRLGLGWWRVDILFRDDPQTILDKFGNEENYLVLAKSYADWRYATAKIDINLPGWISLDSEETERAIVHELVHILVNEMREGEIHHEERVVTTLTKAIFWTEAAVIRDIKGD